MTELSRSSRTALVLGATGGVGGAIARALADHGWSVRAMVRDPARASVGWPAARLTPDFVSGDAMVREDVIRAARQGRPAEIIVHAVNPPGYRDWDKLVLPMIDNTIAAARAVDGARVVLPGTVYNYDPAVTPAISAATPQTAKTRKGRIRVALEQRLADAAPDVPSLILRAGDFLGPGARSSWVSQAMLTAGAPVRKITTMAKGVPHAYAYLPDLAEAFAQLLDSPDRLLPHECLQFEGLWDADGRTLVETIRGVVGRSVPERSFPWWLMRLAAPFGGFPREAIEIEPVWRHPMRLDNTRLVELLGAEPRTPLSLAIEQSLADIGCLPDATAAPSHTCALYLSSKSHHLKADPRSRTP
ncbi:epimerase [Alloyangia pacifica]|uniref:Epimerase n=1 Tax=Alloyangia pacifica TaxID=311180 RepID=A0A2U8HIZ2_9RHOB|nr:NAD-dependent epimerase/dehydratase family protein [Alloyangia pacifica]AWI85773.1 epimerase [Alloyangia pacifica]